MRVTTNSIMRRYNSRLNSVMAELQKSSNKVATGFKISKSAESPSEAAKATRLYTQKLNNDNYLANLRDIVGVFDTMEGSMSTVRDLIGDAVNAVELALNDPAGSDARKILAAELRKIQESIISSVNVRMNDQYLFGGSGTQKLPFELDADGNLMYRGLNVNDPANAKMLDKLANEKIYADLGFGLTVDSASGTNNIVAGSAFNRAIPGISFLGYGVDSSTGYPNNVVTTLGMLADELEKDDFDNSADSEVRKLWTHLKGQFQTVSINITQMGTNQNFLELTKSRLENNQYSLEERIKNTIGIESEQAITEWQYQQYVYSAVLKMGTSILSPSFIDFMK